MKIFVVALLLVVLLHGCVGHEIPHFGEQYYVEGDFSLPYAHITERIRMWYDGVNKRELYDFYNGLDGWLTRLDLLKAYELFVMKDHVECRVYDRKATDQLVSILPDLTDWEYKGKSVVREMDCEHFQLVQVLPENTKVNTYDFYYVNMSNRHFIPVQYHMLGYDVIFGSHYDEYVLDYTAFSEGRIPRSNYSIPDICKKQSSSGIPRGDSQLKQMFPVQNSQHSSAVLKNAMFVNSHNSDPSKTFKMSHNKFSHLHFDEFKSMMFGNSKKSGPGIGAQGLHEPKLNDLPTSFDWREKGAVTDVKDQGVCGSCWSFGTTGTLEGALKLKHDVLIPLSEQQLVDCAWTDKISDFDNNGCDGGMPNRAMEYIMKVGGIVPEFAYPYIMQDGYCQFDIVKPAVAAKVSGYVNVTAGDENALQDALVSKGPISVAINVQKSLIFYSEGVYYDPKCRNDYDSLDHAVLVVGYGTDNGQDYWLVKNSWSTHWGNEGYVKMARNRDNNCGIASCAIYAELE